MPASKSTKRKPAQKKAVVEKAEVVAKAVESPVKAEEKTHTPGQPLKLPKHLEDRMSAATQVFDDIKKEIEHFKAHPHYMEGDMPGTLFGLQGPGDSMHGQSLNYIDEKWVDPDIHIHWSNKRMVDYHRAQGYEPFDADKLKEMLARRGGHLSFTPTAQGHVQIGDVVLIRTSRDHYEKREAYKRKKSAAREGQAKNNLYKQGAELGVEVYEKDFAGPKLSKIVKLLSDEFGADNIKRMFLDH